MLPRLPFEPASFCQRHACKKCLPSTPSAAAPLQPNKLPEQPIPPHRFTSSTKRVSVRMAFFRLPRFNLHHSKWSDWYLGSPSGSGVNFGTPEVKIAVDSNSLRIPLTEIKDGKVTRSIVLKGDGIGVGASVGFQLPFVNVTDSPKNLPGTKDSTPGIGSRVRYSMFSPDPMEPRDFKGVCWVLSVSHTDVGVQASGAMIVFAGEISPYSVLPTSLNASAFCAGLGLASALVNVGGDAVVYTLRLG